MATTARIIEIVSQRLIRFVSSEAIRPAAKARGGGSPLNGDRGGDQQHKEDRQQHRWYEQPAKIEFGDI
ncbi:MULTISPECIES: hypothetical protein [unclassified Bradyrhizobium]|jgi:hypothetical protein|uniref:hypothetical protein n=1 Tax=unclassified Bradyrhizobium TaxID=2631580 RepID=UPI0030CA6981